MGSADKMLRQNEFFPGCCCVLSPTYPMKWLKKIPKAMTLRRSQPKNCRHLQPGTICAGWFEVFPDAGSAGARSFS